MNNYSASTDGIKINGDIEPIRELIDNLDYRLGIIESSNKVDLDDNFYECLKDRFIEKVMTRLTSDKNLNDVYRSLESGVKKSAELAINEFMLSKTEDLSITKELIKSVIEESIPRITSLLIPEINNIVGSMIRNRVREIIITELSVFNNNLNNRLNNIY